MRHLEQQMDYPLKYHHQQLEAISQFRITKWTGPLAKERHLESLRTLLLGFIRNTPSRKAHTSQTWFQTSKSIWIPTFKDKLTDHQHPKIVKASHVWVKIGLSHLLPTLWNQHHQTKCSSPNLEPMELTSLRSWSLKGRLHYHNLPIKQCCNPFFNLTTNPKLPTKASPKLELSLLLTTTWVLLLNHRCNRSTVQSIIQLRIRPNNAFIAKSGNKQPSSNHTRRTAATTTKRMRRWR